MSMPVPNISKLYLHFNQTFTAARMDNPKELPKYIDTLLSLQTALETQAKKTSTLPEKITSLDQLSQDLSAKIEILFTKDVKSAPPAKTPPSGASVSPLVICVGLRNARANCWANALIQFLKDRPDLLQAWNAVADYYAGGHHLDTNYVQVAVNHFHGGRVTEARFTQGVTLFNRITAPFQKLVALDRLIKDGRRNIAIGLRPHLSGAYNAALDQLTRRMSFAEAITTLIQSETAAEQQRLANLRTSGRALRDAITVINQAIAGAQLTGQPAAPIDASITQQVRLAYHTLFGTVNPITGVTTFSRYPGAHEDAHEALQVLMGRYEEISRIQGHAPANYSVLETSRIYQPTTAAPTPINPNYPRDALENGTTSRTSNREYQMILQPTATHDQPVETLLANFLRSPAAPGTEPSYYQAPNNPFFQQSYHLVEERRRFTGPIPQTLTMVIKRFGMTVAGQPYKIHTRVMANRYITMPANAVEANDHDRAYELHSFIAHSGGAGGGHYMTYKKLPDGSWARHNDATVTLLRDADVDMVLHGDTPYMLDYRLVPQSQQQATLELAAQLRARKPIRPVAPPQPVSPLVKELATHQQIIDQLVKLQQLLHKPDSTNKDIMEVFQSLHTLSPICLPLFSKITAWHNGKINESDGVQLLYSNSKQLALIKRGWIRNSSEDIVGQMIRYEREKLVIRKTGLEYSTLATAASKPGASKEQQEALKKKELEYNQLLYKYYLENLRTFQALLRDKNVGDGPLKLLLQGQLDIPQDWVDRLYAAIEKATGKPKGKAQFEANPRLLCAPSPDLLEQFISSLK